MNGVSIRGGRGEVERRREESRQGGLGRLSETWMNFQVILLRMGAIGHHLGADDQIEVEKEISRDDRRRRFVPFAAMVAVGVVAAVVWSRWF